MSKQSGKRGRKPVERDPRWVALGKRLVDLRNAKNWHAYEVAHMIGVDPATISQIENGRRATGPEHDTLARLAQLYQVPIDTLLHGEAHADRDTRIDRPAGRGAPDAGTLVQFADLHAAVSDAIFAVLADLFEALTDARTRRTTPHTRREAGGLVAGATGGQGRH